ncbi:MAG: pyruvate:ferredoxin (flavodoxin) oxidoreductase [Acholeplasmatales bacterium]|jgi:pyruvate-ferredoxin/flavodoxin oxidoreductase|nr:pyruvate:ferredoxin (flavodoxin) oxidoreductase [Acholeplasmatales bacterium]
MSTTKKIIKAMDGNEAAAYASYAFTEVAGIYPITPSTPMAQSVDLWASEGKKNLFGMPVKVIEMQSEAGAAGTVHGSLQMGLLTTTYTASQGLLLKIPNMYKIAGQLLPGVIHVAARSIAAQALSIFGDHQDVMATRQTGFALLATNSVQEVMDLAGVAHLAAIKSRVPFLHFFDGFRTSHEVDSIEVLDYSVYDKLLDRQALEEFRKLGLNPSHPVTRGSAQGEEVYFQTRMVQDSYYESVPDTVNEYMSAISKETGRKYAPFTYYGAKDATHIIIGMGSMIEAAKEAVEVLTKQGKKVGVLSVHLYRPFSAKYFFKALPKTVKRIAVLDRTIESGSIGEPLFLDVQSVFYDKATKPLIIGGKYGLSSRDTSPSIIFAVFDNLFNKKPKEHFTVGIEDDLGNTSIPVDYSNYIKTSPATEVLLYGLGSDGTVGASKNITKIIGDHTKLFSQAYAAYDSKKSGGITRMHLRFSPKPIHSTYLVNNPHFVSCSVESYVHKYDLCSGLRTDGVFLLNTNLLGDELENYLPARLKKQLASKNIKFYVIDAAKAAYELGLGRKINTVMQSAFFKLNEQLLPFKLASKYMKEYAKKTYARKGEAVLEMNYKAIDSAEAALVEVAVKKEWASLEVHEIKDANRPSFVRNIADPFNALKANDLPVSAFKGYEDAHMDNGSSAYEKRGVANFVPCWDSASCIQCNNCVFACPHAVIRPFLVSDLESKNLPEGTKVVALKPALAKKAENVFGAGYQYALAISANDCLECGLCLNVCPTKSLSWKSLEEEQKEQKIFDYLHSNVPYRDLGTDTVMYQSFRQPLFEFSGACGGCGETPYVKSITQLFGDHMNVANATGCSSIYGGSFPSTPYTTNKEGRGPSWANSLFEDAAEFGFGMRIAYETARDRIQNLFINNLSNMNPVLGSLVTKWLENRDSYEITKEISPLLIKELEKVNEESYAKELLSLQEYFVRISQWIFGGDGWAYDIGYGGLDHVMANNLDVNILVLDTQVYSNTGGQSSKASPMGSIAKFTASGKNIKKKDLASIAISYGHVYVGQIAHGANANHVLKVLKEAESYKGPSIVIAYSPCIEHGIKGGLANTFSQAKLANNCGYWPIFSYDPRLKEQNKNPFSLVGKEPDWSKYQEFLLSETRYAQLFQINPSRAQELLDGNLLDAKNRYQNYLNLIKVNEPVTE